MNSHELSDQDLKRFFEEDSELKRDLGAVVMRKIAHKRPMVFKPAKMPNAVLWGVLILLLGTFSTAFFLYSDSLDSFGGDSLALNPLKLPSPSWSIDPILAVACLTVMVGVWTAVLLEKKLLEN